jgi:hypothetical protein
MKILRHLAIGAMALFCVEAFADEASAPPQPFQDAATLAVGGSISPQTETGSPTGKTRDQVYRELVQSQSDGEAARMQALFKGSR